MGASNDSEDSGFASVEGRGTSDPVHEPAVAHRVTLKPPDWKAPASVSSIALERVRDQRPIARRTGNRAEAAALRAQIQSAQQRNDFESERLLTAKLARLLIARGTALAEATKLARRSLLLGEEPKLRAELSAWFSSIGELSLAAGTLQLLLEESEAQSAAWLRVAVLRARDSDARAAMHALRAAFEADPRDPLPLELLASLHSWAPEMVTPARAAQALIEAAKRRHAKGDESGFIEVLLQAIEANPESDAAADRLARQLASSGRYQAADEVWRGCAAQGEPAQRIHELRVREALGARDVPLALSATLDARADTRLDAESLLTAASIVESGAGQVPVPNFDGLLTPLGLSHLLAARLLWLAEQSEPARRARAMVAAARLFEDEDPRRGQALLCEAVELMADSEDALNALVEACSRARDSVWLAEAALRLGRQPVDERVARRLLSLVAVCRERITDPAFGAWLLARAAQGIELSRALRDELDGLQRRADNASPWARQRDWATLSIAELRRALAEMRYKPELSGQYAEAVVEAWRREPQSIEVCRDLERILIRLGRLDELERLWQDTTSRPEPMLGTGYHLIRLFERHGARGKALAMLRDAPERLQPAEVALVAALASLRSDEEQRALGLVRLAGCCTPEVSAVLLCQASETSRQLEHRAAAFHLAERACHDNPRAARPILCCADVAEQTEPRVAMLALERACELVVPRSRYCERLVALAQQQHEPDVALRWARRWVALTPLSESANRVLLEQLTICGDADELAKGLDWFIGQPRPRGVLAPELGRALLRLVELDRGRALLLARRVLSAFGVVDAHLVAVLGAMAVALGQPELRIAVIERQLAAEGDADAAALLCEAAELHVRRGDGDAAFDALVRALDAGADVELVRRLALECPQTATSDGELCRLRCRAECEVRGPDPHQAVDALRQLGAAYWDLASDRQGALWAWERASQLDLDSGDEVFARDLITFSGAAELPALITQVAVLRNDDERVASLLLAGAAVLVHDGAEDAAVPLALAALQRAPRTTEALAVLERAVADDATLLEHAYAIVDGALLGNFGERALHYRAARQFERRREHALALRHAIVAFKAVPAEGVAFALMLRLASLTGEDAQVTRALREVAETEAAPEKRSHWLEIAARNAGPGIEGRRLRAEVLLRALSVRAEPEAVLRVGEAIGRVLELEPSEREGWSQQFDTTLRSVLRSLSNAEDVATAIACACLSADVFESAQQVAAALDRGVALDAGSDAFEPCVRLVTLLSSSASSAMRVVKAIAAAEQEQRTLSPALSTLGLELAKKHAPEHAPALAVARALTEPPNQQWIAAARQLAEGNPELAERLDSMTPREQRLEQLWGESERRERFSPEAALDWLTQHEQERWLTADDQLELQRRIGAVLRCTADGQRLESWLAATLGDERWPVAQRRAHARELIELFTRRGAHAAALDVVAQLERWGALGRDELKLAVDIARSSGDTERELRYLEPQKQLADSPRERVELWRRLWQVHSQLGLSEAATEDAERLLELDPADAPARAYLVEAATRQKDYARAVRLLEEGLKFKETGVADFASLAEVYADKLSDPSAAIDALRRGLRQCGDDALLLSRLARIHQKARRHQEAAETFERARLTVSDPAEVARLAEQACRSYLDAGNSEAALRLLSERLPAHETEGMARLRVDVLRAAGTQEALAEALEQLATIATAPADQRAEWLCEASEIASASAAHERALERAQRAARTAPRSAAAQLLARRLEYGARGAGTAAEALATITELRGLGELRDREQAAVRAFLLAEALDQRVGLGAGQRELEVYQRRYGAHPLISCALAQRLALGARAAEAMPLFDEVLLEDLLGLVDKNQLLLQAIGCGRAVGDEERTRRWVQVASELGLALPTPEPRPRPREVEKADGAPRQRRHPDLAKTWQSATGTEVAQARLPDPEQERTADAEFIPNRSISPRPAVSSEVRASLFPQDAVLVRSSMPVRVTSRPSAQTLPAMGKLAPTPQVRIGPPPKPRRASAQERLSEPPEALFATAETASGVEPAPLPEAARPPEPQPTESRADHAHPANEEQLRQRLEQGDFGAGLQLAELLSRGHERVSVYRQLVQLCPGRVDVLERLYAAAVDDNDVVFANAVKHVLAVIVEPGRVPTAPPLMHQTVQPDALLNLLRGPGCTALEVLGLLWQSAPRLFRKQAPVFESSQRVTNQTVSTLGQVTVLAARLLGAQRVDLFHRDGPAPVQFEMCLEQPVRLLLWGPDTKDSPAFRYQLGEAMLSTQRDYALLFGLGEDEIAEWFEAVLAAFGPPGKIRGSAPRVAHMAERLWEAVPSPAQRLLRELAAHPEELDTSRAVQAAQRARRRAGLFVSGDLWTAATTVCRALSLDVGQLMSSDGLEKLCAMSPELADLVQFAVSVGYADARWRTSRAPSSGQLLRTDAL